MYATAHLRNTHGAAILTPISQVKNRGSQEMKPLPQGQELEATELGLEAGSI